MGMKYKAAGRRCVHVCVVLDVEGMWHAGLELRPSPS